MKAPGRLFIKIPSILYIIGGAAALFAALFGREVLQDFGDFGNTTREFTIFWCVMGLFYLVVGILGFLFCNSTHKTTALITLAVFDMITVVANMYVHFPTLDSHLAETVRFNFEFSLFPLLWFALPVLYLIGAIKNKNYYNPTTTYYSYDDESRPSLNPIYAVLWNCEKCKVINDSDASYCKGCGSHR
jgi:hypothetical protein